MGSIAGSKLVIDMGYGVLRKPSPFLKKEIGSRMFTPEELEKLTKLRDLACIPSNDGEQFINVYLNLVWQKSGHINFGFNWKCDMGEQDFRSLDEAIKIVESLRKYAKPCDCGGLDCWGKPRKCLYGCIAR